MKIIYSRKFLKRYRRLDYKLQMKIADRTEIFKQNPSHPLLRNHALHGEMQGKRAISVTGDMRIVFQEFEGYTVVLFLDVGKHSLVY